MASSSEIVRRDTARHWRRNSGYRLEHLLAGAAAAPFAGEPGGGVGAGLAAGSRNLARLFAGSEGTLGITTGIEMRLVERPKRTVLGIAHFTSLDAALRSVPAMLETRPAAIELFDDYAIRAARNSPGFGAAHGVRERRARRHPHHRVRRRRRPRTRKPPRHARPPTGRRGVRLLHARPRHRHRRDRARVERPQGRTRHHHVGAGRPQAHRLHRGRERAARAPRRLHRGAPQDARGDEHARRPLRPRERRMPARAPVHQHARRGRRGQDGAHRRGLDAPRAAVRRDGVERARRRTRAVVAQPRPPRRRPLRRQRAREADLRPRRTPQPRQRRRGRADDRAAAHRSRDADDVRRDRLRLARRGRPRRGGRAVQRQRRLPQARRGRHVPVVHGHARGAGLDARARQHPPPRPRGRDPRRPRRPRTRRRDGPLRLVQGVQDRVPVERRHGQDEGRVAGADLQDEASGPARPRRGEPAARDAPPAARHAPRRCVGNGADGDAHARDEGDRVRARASAAADRPRDVHRVARAAVVAPGVASPARARSSSSPTPSPTTATPRSQLRRPRGCTARDTACSHRARRRAADARCCRRDS